MAATRLIALHRNKGKSVAACLKSRTDYAQNPDKTDGGEWVSSYECSPLTVDEEFMLSKRQYELSTGRSQKSDVIAYQIRQSFKPGEITPEEANQVGYELAMRFTKGKHAFIVATHTDCQHIHNHIIYNSTSLDGSRKFRDFWLSGLAVQRLSDMICLEHSLSVIERKPYRERQKKILYPPKESNRDRLCAIIDGILKDKPPDFEHFLQRLKQEGYEVKRGKHTSVKGRRQKRFIRFRTLGQGYSEEELRAVLEENISDLIVNFEYDDYDGDGVSEAFGITSPEDYDELGLCGDVGVWFIDCEGNCTQLMSDTYGYLHQQKVTAGQQKFIVWEMSGGGSGSLSYIFGIRDGSPYEPLISGQYMQFETAKYDDAVYVGQTSDFSMGYHNYIITEFVFDSDSGEFVEN